MTEPTEQFSEYVAARQPALVRLAYLLAGDRHAAEDIVQTALARTFLAWERIRDRNAIDAYVRKAIVNEHINWWRRAWRRFERATDELPDSPRPESSLDYEGRAEMRALVRALPPRQRATIVLRYYEGLSTAEAAEVLGCSVSTVKSHTNRALKALRSTISTSSTPGLVEGRQT